MLLVLISDLGWAFDESYIHKVWLGHKEQKPQVLATDKVNDSEEEINNLCPCLSVKFKYNIQKKIAYINRTIESWLQLRRLVVI